MHLGLVGYGSIGSSLLGLLWGELALQRITVLVRPDRRAEATAALQAMAQAEIVASADELIARCPDLIVECAGHAAVRETVIPALRAGIDTIIVSVGALADPALERDVQAAASEGGAQLTLPAGAVGGIDLLTALAAAGDCDIVYTGTKPPAAWRGTPAETLADLDTLSAPFSFFTGTAREAAAAYPKNANVTATLALATGGFDRTRVELVADPGACGNLHAFEVRSPFANISIRIENKPSSGNIKTSAATIYSVLRAIRNRIQPVVI